MVIYFVEFNRPGMRPDWVSRAGLRYFGRVGMLDRIVRWAVV